MKAMVSTLRMAPATRKNSLALIRGKPTFLEKCVYSKALLTSHTYGKLLEREICNAIGIGLREDDGPGDAVTSSGETVEVKVSLSDPYGRMNLVQLRPHEKIDHYVLLMYDMSADELGACHTMLLKGSEMDELVSRYGCYAHGSKRKLGAITSEAVSQGEREYALRPCTTASPRSASRKCWDSLYMHRLPIRDISSKLSPTTPGPPPSPGA
jgi:hypothetical protein